MTNPEKPLEPTYEPSTMSFTLKDALILPAGLPRKTIRLICMFYPEHSVMVVGQGNIKELIAYMTRCIDSETYGALEHYEYMDLNSNAELVLEEDKLYFAYEDGEPYWPLEFVKAGLQEIADEENHVFTPGQKENTVHCYFVIE